MPTDLSDIPLPTKSHRLSCASKKSVNQRQKADGKQPFGVLHCSSEFDRYSVANCRARSGGLATQLIFSSIHAAVHVTIALTLMLLLELGVETCVRCAHQLRQERNARTAGHHVGMSYLVS